MSQHLKALSYDSSLRGKKIKRRLKIGGLIDVVQNLEWVTARSEITLT